jgi:N-methylhydantoinase B
MLAQAVIGTPGHVNTMAAAVRHFLDRVPIAIMRPGDVVVTNDPWFGTGHLFDFVMLTPVFRGEQQRGVLRLRFHGHHRAGDPEQCRLARAGLG